MSDKATATALGLVVVCLATLAIIVGAQLYSGVDNALQVHAANYEEWLRTSRVRANDKPFQRCHKRYALVPDNKPAKIILRVNRLTSEYTSDGTEFRMQRGLVLRTVPAGTLRLRRWRECS